MPQKNTIQFPNQVSKTVALLQLFSHNLEAAMAGKVSTADITPDRLLWEIFNKVFTILVTCENCLNFKDSLSVHLVARYTYEMLVVFAYIFLEKSRTQERVDQFLNFSQFKSTERMWTDKTFKQMLDSIPDKTRFAIHSKHYRNLSNFAHPTMDSFLLNRRGDVYEFSMILSTVLLTLGTILEIARTCVQEDLYFNEEQKKMLKLEATQLMAQQIMDEVRIELPTMGVSPKA